MFYSYSTDMGGFSLVGQRNTNGMLDLALSSIDIIL